MVLGLSLGGAIVSLLVFMLWVIWIWLLITVFIDIFRSHELSGWAKALWVLFVIILPFLGVLIYLIVRGDAMHQRGADEAAARDKAQREYIRRAAGSSGPSAADELAKLADLHAKGVLSDDEYASAKAKALG